MLLYLTVDGSWGTWGPWALCSKTCGGGKQHRERKCDSPAPAHGGTNCTGNTMQLDDCNTILCPLPSSGKYINVCVLLNQYQFKYIQEIFRIKEMSCLHKLKDVNVSLFSIINLHKVTQQRPQPLHFYLFLKSTFFLS